MEAIIDRSALDNLKMLQEKTGKNLIEQLSQLYFEATPAIVEKISELNHLKKYEDLAREAHSLKSTSANMGVMCMAEVCREIEYKIMEEEEGYQEQIPILIDRLKELYPTALLRLKEVLDSLQ